MRPFASPFGSLGLTTFLVFFCCAKPELLNDRRSYCCFWEFSPFVFPNFRKPSQPTKDIRHSWAKALEDAGIAYFWIYNLRHTFTSRLSAAGVPDLFVAQMIGHSSPGILQVYSKAIDDFRRDAVRKLEQMRTVHNVQTHNSATSVN